MERKTLTLRLGSLIRILGPALSFISASEAADQNCPARQHLSATQHVEDREDLRPSIIQPNENANGLQESLEPFSLQHFEALKRQNHDLMEIATLLSTTLKKTQQQLSFIKQQNKKLKIAAIKTEQEKQSLEIQLQQQTQARKAAEERKAELEKEVQRLDLRVEQLIEESHDLHIVISSLRRDAESKDQCIHDVHIESSCLPEEDELLQDSNASPEERLHAYQEGLSRIYNIVDPIECNNNLK